MRNQNDTIATFRSIRCFPHCGSAMQAIPSSFLSYLVAAALVIVAPSSLMSQCDLSDPNCTDWYGDPNQFQIVELYEPSYCKVKVFYQVRICNGTVTEYRINGYEPIDGCASWDPAITTAHYQYNSFRDYITAAFLQLKMWDSHIGSIPVCSTGVRKMIFNVYTASCGIWLSCEYELPPGAPHLCENGWDPEPHPHYGAQPQKVKTTKWFSCGTQCCRRTYYVCRESDPIYPTQTHLNVQLVSKTALGDCTGQSRFDPKPCESDCN